MILETGRNKGFTLVEVIVSIGILSFGLILILQGFAQSLNTISISHSNLQASLLADEVMTQFLIDSYNTKVMSLDNLNGETEFDDAEYNWRINTQQDKDQAELNEVFSTVSWKSGRRKGKILVSTYLRIPLDDKEE
ncbi:MAG: prepilin-type N-terminal cleavage/methylation domain-containing protein [Dehalococcoidia bacterium]|nr:MAG: prepilin-type N-terminal cleavage/methylation domain-containing protein [Dehalococcoidia bacterium]